MYLCVLRADEDICKLYCIAEDFDFFFAMSSRVKDGTSCSDHKGDVCIDGVCEVRCLYGLSLLHANNFALGQSSGTGRKMLHEVLDMTDCH